MSRDRSSPSRPIRSDRDRPNRHTDHAATMSNSRRGYALEQRIQPRPLLTAQGATDALVAVDRHDRPAKPPSSLLERL